ncbi:MAG TPA: ATP-binding protein [Myxococcota bacterium]|nr:ATP-binding protein [Myxococcota bacterium]HPV03532.1 ATP-binding protein [Myxococcota bacterium]
MIERTITTHVEKILNEWNKIVLLSGPRQVGKTTLAKHMLDSGWQGTYFNWDNFIDQKRLVLNPYFFRQTDREPSSPALLVLDEIHKYAMWKNWLKGAWDADASEWRFLVTGSGRLDLFRRGADSLLGRAVGVLLLPLSVGELKGAFPSWQTFIESLWQAPAPDAGDREHLDGLFRFGGFPEPFVRAQDDFSRVWRQERNKMLIRQDIRDATRIREISMLEVLGHLVPERVGSPLSINSLREDLGVAFETVRDWLLIFEQFHYLFTVTPWAGTVARALKKEKKAYLHDWADIASEGPRFENMVAAHLFKAVQTWRSTGSADVGLYYFRDREKREVDFVLCVEGRPRVLVEAKSGDSSVSPALLHARKVLGAEVVVQVVNKSGICRNLGESGSPVWVMSADRFLAMLP